MLFLVKSFVGSLAGKLVLAGILAVGAGLTYLAVKVYPEKKYEYEIPREAKSYKECIRKAQGYFEEKKCREVFK